MKNNSIISFVLGLTYVALAILSLFIDFPAKVTNMVSLGAVLLSFSEVLILINNHRIKNRSFVAILKNPELENKTTMALSYITEIMDEKISILSVQNSWLFYTSLGLKVIALFCIILSPFIVNVPPFFESSKCGVFCTIISLGVIFLSFYIDSDKKNDKDIDDMYEIIDCYKISLDEKNKIVDEYLNTITNSGIKGKKSTKQKTK